jgi:hypothetical protein
MGGKTKTQAGTQDGDQHQVLHSIATGFLHDVHSGSEGFQDLCQFRQACGGAS